MTRRTLRCWTSAARATPRTTSSPEARATQALEAGDRLIYDSTTGALFFDPDGSSRAFGAIQFATLGTHPAYLSAADFAII